MENQENAFVTERMVDFKKTLFGIKEKDVFEYIDLLTNNLNKARTVYEEKLTEMKNANELLNCERGNQEEKLQELTRMYQALLEDRNNLKQTVDYQHRSCRNSTCHPAGKRPITGENRKLSDH